MPVPIREDKPTVPPAPATYSTCKVAMERRRLHRARILVILLRPCATEGSQSKHARAWWFVGRLLDGR